MQQNNAVILGICHNPFDYLGSVLGTPILGINAPQNTNHPRIAFNPVVALSKGRADKLGTFSRYLLNQFIGGYYLRFNQRRISIFKPYMMEGMVSDQMPVICNLLHNIGVFFHCASHEKKSNLYSPLLKPFQKHGRIDGMRTVVKGQGNFFSACFLGFIILFRL